MAIDKEAIKEHIRGILVALGDDPNREGLKEKMCIRDRLRDHCTQIRDLAMIDLLYSTCLLYTSIILSIIRRKCLVRKCVQRTFE